MQRTGTVVQWVCRRRQAPPRLFQLRSTGRHPGLRRCSYDKDDKRTHLEGLMYAMDVSKVMGDKLVPCKPSDFETWTVPDASYAPRCLLGEQGAGVCAEVQGLRNCRRSRPAAVRLRALRLWRAGGGVAVGAHVRCRTL